MVLSFLYRPVAKYVAWLAITMGLQANTITVVSIVFGVFGAALLGRSDGWISLILLQIYAVLDYADGTVARVRATESLLGAYLDSLGHYIVEFTLYISIATKMPFFRIGCLGPIALLVLFLPDCMDVAAFTRCHSMRWHDSDLDAIVGLGGWCRLLIVLVLSQL